MITDARTLFSDGQAITASAASTNVMDLKALGITYDGVQLTHKVGVQAIPLFVGVTADFNTLTSLAIEIQSDTVENFASPTTILSVGVPLASLVAGYQLPIDILPIVEERFLRVYYTVVGTNPTLGNVEAGIFSAVERRG